MTDQDFATDVTQDDQWQEVAPDFAPAHDFDNEPIFVGTLQSRRTVEIQTDDGPRDTSVYDCVSQDGERAALWGSYALDQKLAEIEDGSRIKVVYKGKESIGGGQQVRRYEVFVARS